MSAALEERFQLGDFWLSRHSTSPNWQITWYNPETGQTQRSSTRTSDFELAKVRLAEHYVSHGTLKNEQPELALISVLLDKWYEAVGRKQASWETNKLAIAKWKQYWGTRTVADITPEESRKFIEWMSNLTYIRGRADNPNAVRQKISKGGMARQYNVGCTALRWANAEGLLLTLPKLKGVFDNTRRKRTLTLQELAKLFNAAADVEHHWRWLLLTCATAGRPNVVLEIQAGPPMVDLENDRLDLLPPGKEQDPRKRRPTIPIPKTLRPHLELWTREDKLLYVSTRKSRRVTHLITYKGNPVNKIKSAFEAMKLKAGITDPKVIPYSIRHTVTTWFMKQRTEEWDREVWLGHQQPGSKTTAGYIHLDPDYLQSASEAIDALFMALDPLLDRPILARSSASPVTSTEEPGAFA